MVYSTQSHIIHYSAVSLPRTANAVADDRPAGLRPCGSGPQSLSLTCSGDLTGTVTPDCMTLTSTTWSAQGRRLVQPDPGLAWIDDVTRITACTNPEVQTLARVPASCQLIGLMTQAVLVTLPARADLAKR